VSGAQQMKRLLDSDREQGMSSSDSAVIAGAVEELKHAMGVEDCSRGAVKRFVGVLARGLVGPQHSMCPLGHDGLYCGLYEQCPPDNDALHRLLVRLVCEAAQRFGQQQNTRFGPLLGRRSDMGYFNVPRDVLTQYVAPRLCGSDLRALAATCGTLNEWASSMSCGGVAISVLRQLPLVYDQNALLALLRHAYEAATVAACAVYTAQCRARHASVLFAADLGEVSIMFELRGGIHLEAQKKCVLIVELGGLLWAISFDEWISIGEIIGSVRLGTRASDFPFVQCARWTGSSEPGLKDVEAFIGFCSSMHNSLPSEGGLDLSLTEWSSFCGLPEAVLLGSVARDLWDVYPRTEDEAANETMMQVASNTVLQLARAAFGADADAVHHRWLKQEELDRHGWAQRFQCDWKSSLAAGEDEDDLDENDDCLLVDVLRRFLAHGTPGSEKVFEL
jgi:hypothetical protein